MGRSTAKLIAVLAMGEETPEQQSERAADLRKQADKCEADAMAREDAGDGEEAIALRAQAHRVRNLAAIVEPKTKKKPSRGGG